MDLSKGEIWRIFAKLTFIMSSLVVITSAFSCNFDASMCGFVQDRIDDFDWIRHQGSTASLNTGPSADHTNGNGYYMYIEASYPRQPGDYARLNSPLLQFSGSMCLQFYYYMYGASMGTLTVSTNGSNVFNASGDKGNQWLGVAINVNLLGMYMVTFKGTVGGNYKSDIAIDDFALESGSCPSKYCVDPGTPVHGSRNVDSTDGRFPDGTIVSFQCNTNYKLSGAKKIVCTKGRWSEKKLPRCLSQVCPSPPPTFAHAHVISNPVLNTKGSYVEYACDLGYVSDHHSTRLLCDKDSKTLGYKWSGNFTCEKVKCSPPPPPRTGHGNVNISTSGSTTEASYYCNPGYLMFDFRQQIVDTFVMKCDPSGSWSSRSPTCLKSCPPPDVSHAHGSVVSTSPYYPICYQGVEVTIVCDDLYKLQGSTGRMRCLESGKWSRSTPRCVRSACKSPDPIEFGFGTSNNTGDSSQFPIWTVVTFHCMAGYKLVGDSQQRCMPDGTWSEKFMPECQASTVRCEIPQNPDHGKYETHGKTFYKLNEVVTVVCIGDYYLWGEAKKKCCGLDNGQSAWLPTSSKCSEPTISDYSDTECLNREMFDDKCKDIGKHAAILNDIMLCKAASVDESSTSSEKRESELDKMTIVVATAGSTLGALIVLLTALVCFRRFHRSRRFRRYSFRSRRYSDDDRIAIIAAYTGDVHFILPSYDEAISQVERSPPSFESVVEGAPGSANEPPPNSNNTSNSQVENLEAISASENTNSAEPVGDSTSIQEHDATAEQQPIRIVSNPLADTASDTRSNETVQTADPASETGVRLSLSSSDAEVWPDRPPESLPSSSSEDDLTSSQTRPLLGNGSRGFLV